MHLTSSGAKTGEHPPDIGNGFTGDSDFDSACSTPFVSAPSSPTRGAGAPSGYFFSAPSSPVHYLMSSDKAAGDASSDFEFSSKGGVSDSGGSGSMSSADELFLNGKIRPMKLSSHLQRPQLLTPLLDLDEEEEEEKEEVGSGGVGADGEKTFMMMRGRDMRLRNRSLHRKTRSLSPPPLEWRDEQVQALNDEEGEKQRESDLPTEEAAMSGSASSSRSSSSGGRNSRKWIFLKDLLYRSKSEGRASTKEKFWSFSPAKEKKSSISSAISTASKSEETACEKGKKQQQQRLVAGKPANGNVSKRRVPPSAHELHYTANRAQAEEMKKRTYLPYRQGLFGCLGFSSKGYGVLQGFTKTLNPVSST